ncbi:MAG: outer membrane beta-barrel protein [Alphaproteobacteria bacterium]|nr:outer membrane beta-barrel protein [Alphaproteobacteria bacterium]
MKKILSLFVGVMLVVVGTAGASNFKPYIGVDAGLNIADFTTRLDFDDRFYSATINAGARIGRGFGVEFFFTHSSSNELDYIIVAEALNHEIYYMGYGFDVFGYYNMSQDFDFFTSFGVANYRMYNKFEYVSPYQDLSSTQSDNNIATRFGIGVMYSFPGDSASGLIQYQYVPVNSEIINVISEFSIGFRYYF